MLLTKTKRFLSNSKLLLGGVTHILQKLCPNFLTFALADGDLSAVGHDEFVAAVFLHSLHIDQIALVALEKAAVQPVIKIGDLVVGLQNF